LNTRGFESRFVTTQSARQHYYDVKGRGKLGTVVVLHGIGSAATPFAGLIGRLLPHFGRVVAPEMPGHGFSDPPREPLTPPKLGEAMNELLDRVLDEPALVFGNSLGGAIALGYALARPSSVRGLFLASPAGAVMPEAELRELLRVFDMRSSDDARRFLGRLYH